MGTIDLDTGPICWAGELIGEESNRMAREFISDVDLLKRLNAELQEHGDCSELTIKCLVREKEGVVPNWTFVNLLGEQDGECTRIAVEIRERASMRYEVIWPLE